MITPPFANYHRAKLERLVREGFERIERYAAEMANAGAWGRPSGLPMDPFEFQVLMAADAYLRATKGDAE